MYKHPFEKWFFAISLTAMCSVYFGGAAEQWLHGSYPDLNSLLYKAINLIGMVIAMPIVFPIFRWIYLRCPICKTIKCNPKMCVTCGKCTDDHATSANRCWGHISWTIPDVDVNPATRGGGGGCGCGGWYGY